MNKQTFFAQLPSVDTVLKDPQIINLQDECILYIIKASIVQVIDELRAKIIASKNEAEIPDMTYTAILAQIITTIHKNHEYSLRAVINATGTILHTNLGRSKLSDTVKEKMNEILFNYSNLEYNLEEGTRGSRYSHLEKTILDLTGAEDVLVVNNNAAAVLLVLNTMAKDKEVIISRGELVEIGGSFRIPDIIASSGCIIKEVGTTNKTHLADYAKVITDNTGVLLKVHTSNYRIIGFTQEVEVNEITALSKQHNIPTVADLGSGLLMDMTEFGLSYEPTVPELISNGCDIITFSGDKLLGGPQAGIIVGKREYIQAMKKNPLTRALRVDKMTIIALEATLRLYLDPKQALEHIPTLNMLSVSLTELEAKAKYFANQLSSKLPELNILVESDHSQVGGGSYPELLLPTYVIKLNSQHCSVNNLEQELRLHKQHIISRINKDNLIFDVRTLAMQEIDIIVDTLTEILA